MAVVGAVVEPGPGCRRSGLVPAGGAVARPARTCPRCAPRSRAGVGLGAGGGPVPVPTLAGAGRPDAGQRRAVCDVMRHDSAGALAGMAQPAPDGPMGARRSAGLAGHPPVVGTPRLARRPAVRALALKAVPHDTPNRSANRGSGLVRIHQAVLDRQLAHHRPGSVSADAAIPIEQDSDRWPNRSMCIDAIDCCDSCCAQLPGFRNDQAMCYRRTKIAPDQDLADQRLAAGTEVRLPTHDAWVCIDAQHENAARDRTDDSTRTLQPFACALPGE